MAGETADLDALRDQADGEKGEADQKRERSTISFPYNNIDDAIAVARAIHGNAGLSCDMNQLAAYMGQTVTGGAFRLTVSSARIFGLIETDKGNIALTELGQQIVDPAQERKAKAEAFLQVPLYKAVFEKYRSATLPPPKALEREMVVLGVAQKQAERARQVFDRSADKAGFFEQGKNRLVMPAVRDVSPPKEEERKTTRRTGIGDGNPHHPFIEGLLQKLPESDAEWPLADRMKWLQAATHIFELMYTMAQDERGEIKVSIERPRDAA
jgi:hypothetical protein